MNEANSYTEEVRRSVNENYGFEKLYSQGLSIRTPLNINYQLNAIKSLRKGIEQYDRRRGWRGAITNKNKDKNWKNKIDKIKLDPTLNWRLAEIIETTNSEILFKIVNENNKTIKESIQLSNIKWSLKKNQKIDQRHKVGDIIFVKKRTTSGSLNNIQK